VIPIKYTLENGVISFRRLNAKEEDCDIRSSEIGSESPEKSRTEAVTKSESEVKKNRRQTRKITILMRRRK